MKVRNETEVAVNVVTVVEVVEEVTVETETEVVVR